MEEKREHSKPLRKKEIKTGRERIGEVKRRRRKRRRQGGGAKRRRLFAAL